MQRVAAFVLRQPVLAPVEDEASAADSIGVAAGDGAEIDAVAQIGFQPVEPKRYVALAARHRHKQFGNPRAILRDGRAQAGVAAQRKGVDPRSIGHATEQM